MSAHDVGLGKGETFIYQPVEIGRVDFFVAQCADRVVALIVTQYDEYIGSTLGLEVYYNQDGDKPERIYFHGHDLLN